MFDDSSSKISGISQLRDMLRGRQGKRIATLGKKPAAKVHVIEVHADEGEGDSEGSETPELDLKRGADDESDEGDDLGENKSPFGGKHKAKLQALVMKHMDRLLPPRHDDAE